MDYVIKDLKSNLYVQGMYHTPYREKALKFSFFEKAQLAMEFCQMSSKSDPFNYEIETVPDVRECLLSDIKHRLDNGALSCLSTDKLNELLKVLQ